MAAVRAASTREFEKKIDAAVRGDEYIGSMPKVQSFMNYASAPLGAKKYDASTLTGISAR